MIWKKMVNLNDYDIRLPHDGYLKLWQLSKPRLSKYGVIMIDEAQDLTPGWYPCFFLEVFR
jgi:F-box protein 18 (helicase)